MRIFLVLLYSLIFLLTSCTKSSLEEYRDEGEGIIRSLIKTLQVVESKNDLIDSCAHLEKLFDQLARLMIAAKEFQESHPKIDQKLTKENHELSDQLRFELNRIFHIDGGKELIEHCQEHSVQLLDAYEKRIQKKKNRSVKGNKY